MDWRSAGVWTLLSLAVLVGCADSRDEIARLRQEFHQQLQVMESRISQTRKDASQEAASLNAATNASLSTEIAELNANHAKAAFETEKALLSLDKKMLANDRFDDELNQEIRILKKAVAGIPDQAGTRRLALPAGEAAPPSSKNLTSEGVVTKVEGTKVFISLGRRDGMQAGQQIEVFSPGSSGQKLGLLRLASVEEFHSVGTIVSGAGSFDSGDVVRLAP